MFTKYEPETKLSKALDKALSELEKYQSDSDEYATIMEQIVKLHKMKEDEKPSTVDPNTVALIVANLIGIVMILKHERADIITSKAMSFVLKPR